VTNNTKIQKLKEDTVPFWTLSGQKLIFKPTATVQFLELYGWGYFQSHKKRTVKKELFHNDSGVLMIHNEETAKKWILDFLKSIDENVFLGDGILASGSKQCEILDAWINLSREQWNKILSAMTVHSEEKYHNTTPINVFRDCENSSHIRFQNGVVKITKDSIDIISKEELIDQGCIWESEQHDHYIKLKKEKTVGLFEQFVINAFKKRDHSKNNDDWRDGYVLDEDQLTSFKQAYGYLIHGHKALDKLKCILCYDSEGSFVNPKGGNGKTLTMDSIKYYKMISTIAGKQWMKGDKFVWSDVTAETKFVLINDIETDFNFQTLFNVITDDFQTEGKGINKVIIPKEKSPKVAITSNGIITGSGTSFERRKHIIEFGNYWKRCSDENENVSDEKHIGKQLFSHFNNKDWIDFYNFGFHCVQEYLRKGLTHVINDNYVERAKIVILEGSMGTGITTRWIADWIKTTRIEGKYNEKPGIDKHKLYSAFTRDNSNLASHMPNGYTESEFINMVFNFVMMTDGLDYNSFNSHKGDTKSNRRHLVGTRNNQKEYIVISCNTDSSSIETEKPAAVDTVEEMMIAFRKFAA